MTYIMGIDPGKSGGLALISLKGQISITHKFVDKTLTDLYEIFLHLDIMYNCFCFIICKN